MSARPLALVILNLATLLSLAFLILIVQLSGILERFLSGARNLTTVPNLRHRWSALELSLVVREEMVNSITVVEHCSVDSLYPCSR